jgi:WD40 repeat protein
MTVFNDRGTNANSRVSSLAFSPDGKLLVSALDHIKLWRAATDADVQARRGQ